MKPAMVVVLVLAVCLYLLLPPASSGVHLPQARPQDGPQAGALSSGSASEVDRGHTGAGAPTSPAQEVISDTRVCLPLVRRLAPSTRGWIWPCPGSGATRTAMR
ncbi:MAG: hypothetical protein P8129_22555 [Anaerolineae bacterium]